MLNEYKLDSKWTFYIHLQNDNNWDYSGYHNIITLDTVEKAVLLNEELSFELIKKTMLFVMRENIKPMWEDIDNQNGGGFSFKVHNKNIEQVWKKLFFLLIGESLTNKVNFENINGISLSPKKSFCIVKIWMKNCNLINPVIFQDIEHMDKNGCIFKKHVSD
jgi:translation initiation factor 4E